ncbi:stromelysin-1-like [Branchiostoma lanceolatum]|uniref:stromelysin-1-like n=1 Tax=Branchiostoma lanceolatum TaxID=7740 RepID=UPI003456EB9B
MRLAFLFVLLCVLALLAPGSARPPKRKDGRHRPGHGHGRHGHSREDGGPGGNSGKISREDEEDDDLEEDDGRMEWEMDGDEDEEEGGRPGRGRGKGKGKGKGRGGGRGHGRGRGRGREDMPEEEDEEEDQGEEFGPTEPGDFGNVHEDFLLEKYYVGQPLGLEQVDPVLEEERQNVPNVTMAVKYLDQFGWYEGGEEMAKVRSASDMTTSMTEAVCKFQKFAGLDVTCEIDEPTLDMMNMRRCGVRDVRVANFVLGNKWDHNDLTYNFKNFSPDLKEEEQKDAIAKALGLWAQVTPLTFTLVAPDDEADIVIQFLSGDHGDGSPFDGNGGTLGHAFFPGDGIGGDTHFDEAEVFNIVTPGEFTTAVDMMTVAAHEFGHALGLGHSNIEDALMAPFYRYSPELQLHVDDINGVQELYGIPSTVAPTLGNVTTEAATTQGQDTTTQGEELTTAFVEDTTLGDASTTVSTPRMPEPTSTLATTQAPTTTPEPTTTAAPEPTTTPSAPEPTTTNAPEPTTTNAPEPTTTEAPETTTTTTAEPTTTQPATTTPGPDDADTCSGAPIDAITTLKNETTFVFRGKYFWRLNSRGADPGYPQLIADAWDGLPDNIDAALNWPTGKTYFFKGDEYWRFENAKMDDGYPKDISNWGLPGDIDAAMYFKRGRGSIFGRGRAAVTYFFKGDRYVRYATRTGVDQGYPKDISKWGRKFPDRLDAALLYSNGRNYVFEGDNYYRLTRSGRVYFGYPRSVAKWWMGCD